MKCPHPALSLLAPVLIAIHGSLSPAVAQGTATAMDFDTYASTLLVITRPSGLLAALGLAGREHAVWARRWTGALTYNPANPRALSLEIAAPVSAMEVDSEEARSRAGLRSSAPGDGERAELKRRLTERDGLDVEHFAEVRFRSLAVDPAPDGGRSNIRMKGLLTLHGVSREVAVPIHLSTAEGGTVRLAGTLVLKLSDYGVKGAASGPATRDEVELRIDLRTKAETSVAER